MVLFIGAMKDPFGVAVAAPRYSEDVRSVTDLKFHAADILDHARRERRPVLLTRRGRGVAVLLDLGEYERLADRAAFVKAMGDGLRAVREGRLRPHGEALKILRSFGKPDAR